MTRCRYFLSDDMSVMKFGCNQQSNKCFMIYIINFEITQNINENFKKYFYRLQLKY